MTPEKFDYPEIVETYSLSTLQMGRVSAWIFVGMGLSNRHMGIRSMPWNEWIELGSEFQFYQRLRQFQLRRRSREVVHVLPLRAEGQPRNWFSSWRSTFLDDIRPLSALPGSNDKLETLNETDMDEAAMKIVTGLVQENMAITIKGTDGKYYFQAGLVCMGGSWRMRDKIGKSLDEIHLSGNVPQSLKVIEGSENSRCMSHGSAEVEDALNLYKVLVWPIESHMIFMKLKRR
ncbi:hypothetical protein V8B97DRAFT_2111875 [Scleroderma yunnanense]